MMMETRSCSFCKEVTQTIYNDGTLVKYSTRHYAHVQCLQEAKGEAWVKANVNKWMVKLAKKNAPPPDRFQWVICAAALELETEDGNCYEAAELFDSVNGNYYCTGCALLESVRLRRDEPDQLSRLPNETMNTRASEILSQELAGI